MAVSSDSQGSQDSAAVHLYDVDELNHAVSGSNLEVVQLKPGRLDAVLCQHTFSGFSIDQGGVNQSLRVCGRLDPQRFTIGLFPPRTMGTLNGNHVDNSRLLFFKPGSELNGHTSATYSWTSLIVPLHWVAAMAQVLHNPRAFSFRSECTRLQPDPGRIAELWLAVGAMITPATMRTDSVDANKWLLTDMQNALGAALSSLDVTTDKADFGALAHFSMARRTERYMRERLTDPVCIDEVCVAMRVSRRYLEYAFADAFGTSPSHYFRLLRLVEVRRRLRTLGNATTVTEEATRHGFSHLSLFSVQYKKLFGQSPSITLASSAR